MKKSLLIALMITALLGVFAVSMVSAADAPGDGLEMKYPADGAKYAPIMFNHSTHAAQKCEDCHHKTAESKDMKCTTCHADTSKEGKKKADGYYQAFHSKAEQSCNGCHKTAKKGPTKCNDCHTKK
ncbi:MAG: cytochrome c3 family protein [Proteobacteria bacterium]|nr:cytochrome c3 family protein [Pseudomonadota bacterium]MBU1612417.1 cytochrome c3 family protein [Pseudomonadota bacterium]